LAKSLKDQNRWHLWLAMAANIIVFYALMQSDEIAISGFKVLIDQATHLLPVGLAIVVTTVVNGLMSADAKARLVFLRWRHALPGHRAFSQYAMSDSRIDVAKLKKACGNKFPDDPAEQNSTWYRLYKSVDKASAVVQVQRDFLLTRDYAAFSALCAIAFGLAALAKVQPLRVSLAYLAFLVLQFMLARQAAANYGARFVTTVMAHKAAPSAPKT